MSDIRLRAITQIGKISRELEKTQGTRTELLPTERKKSKEEQLEAAGISTSTAKSFCARAERLLVKPCSLSVVELSLPSIIPDLYRLLPLPPRPICPARFAAAKSRAWPFELSGKNFLNVCSASLPFSSEPWHFCHKGQPMRSKFGTGLNNNQRLPTAGWGLDLSFHLRRSADVR
jgi:hypothetical protein